MAYTLEVIFIIASINQLETGQGMNYLINISFWTYLFLAIFMGICFACGGIYGIISNTKKMENKVLKRILRLSVSSICIVFWLWFFVYKNLYPIALAKYEYEHNCAEEQVGTVDSVVQDGKDRIITVIDGVKYTIVYASGDSNSIEIGKDIDRGNIVKFRYGKNSKFIFDISKSDTNVK